LALVAAGCLSGCGHDRDGAADIVELVQTQTTLAQSRSQAVTARTNLYAAYADLIYAIGDEPTL